MGEDKKLLLKNMTLLYVEDHAKTITDVEKIFSVFFGKTLIATNGKEALEVLDKNKVDIIITDINMPNMDGITMVEQIRKVNKKISIIILTAYADRDLLLKATNLQIDGYLTKPINFTKIIDSLNNALDRIDFIPTIKFGDNFIYNLNTMELFADNISIVLGAKENQFLAYLLKNKNKVISKEELMDNVWLNDYPSDSAFKNLIYNIRKKIGKDIIENIPGSGWKITIN